MGNKSRSLSSVEFVVVIALVAISGLFCVSCLEMYFDPSLALRQSCQNNLKQWGLIYKMYSYESPGGDWPPMSNYAFMGDASVATPDLRAVYPEYLSDVSIANCPEDDTGGFGIPLALPFDSGLEQIQALMAADTATQDCMLLHVTLARSYVYFNYATQTPAEGEVAWAAWGKAGDATLRGVQGEATYPGHAPAVFGGTVDLGPNCPYATGATVYHLNGRVLGGSVAPDGPFMNAEGDVVTAWRGDVSADPPSGPGWDAEKNQRVPAVIERMRQRVTRNVAEAPGDLPENALPEAEIPVMWDVFVHNLTSGDHTVQITNHIPGGSNVLFMDGHVEFIEWTPPFGDRYPMKTTPTDAQGDGKGWPTCIAAGRMP